MEDRLILALYDPCGKGELTHRMKIDNTPEGRRFCRQVIEFFRRDTEHDLGVLHSLGVFSQSDATSHDRNRIKETT